MSTDEFRAFERSGLRKAGMNTTVFSFIVITFQPRVVLVGSERRASSTTKERRRRCWIFEQRHVGGCDDGAPLILRDEDGDASFCSEEASIADFSAIAKDYFGPFSGSDPVDLGMPLPYITNNASTKFSITIDGACGWHRSLRRRLRSHHEDLVHS